MTPSARLTWVRMSKQTGDAGLTRRRCGVSRPTLRKWWRRYQAEGLAGLTDRSRRPPPSPRPSAASTGTERRVKQDPGGMTDHPEYTSTQPPNCPKSRTTSVHHAHQPTNPVPTHTDSVPPQMAHHLAATVERVLQKQLIDPPHQLKVLPTLASGPVVPRRADDGRQAALTARAQFGMVALDHGPAHLTDHHLSPLAKFRSTVNLAARKFQQIIFFPRVTMCPKIFGSFMARNFNVHRPILCLNEERQRVGFDTIDGLVQRHQLPLSTAPDYHPNRVDSPIRVPAVGNNADYPESVIGHVLFPSAVL